jgi:hypothetical protein
MLQDQPLQHTMAMNGRGLGSVPQAHSSCLAPGHDKDWESCSSGLHGRLYACVGESFDVLMHTSSSPPCFAATTIDRLVHSLDLVAVLAENAG